MALNLLVPRRPSRVAACLLCLCCTSMGWQHSSHRTIAGLQKASAFINFTPHRALAPSTLHMDAALQKVLSAGRRIRVVPELDVQLPDMQLMQLSAACRELGAAALLLKGGEQQVAPVVAEQRKARGGFPGPCPVIHDARAAAPASVDASAALGVQAVTVAARLSEAELQDVLGSCREADVSPVVIVENEEQLQQAVSLKVGIVLLMGEWALGVRDVPEGMLAISQVQAMQPGAQEITSARGLGEGQVSAVALCGGSQESDFDRYLKWVITQIRSKTSSEFRDFSLAQGTLGVAKQERDPTVWRRCVRDAQEIQANAKTKYADFA